MISTIQISNFRCFREASFGPFEQVNLFTGPNGIGKSTLLEALWLLHGRRNAGLVWRPIIQRRFTSGEKNPLSLLWNSEGSIVMEGKELDGSTVRVSYDGGSTLSVPLGRQSVQQSEPGTGMLSQDLLGGGGMVSASRDVHVAAEVVTTYREGSSASVTMRAKLVVQRGLGATIEQIIVENQPSLVGLPSGILLTATRSGLDLENAGRFSRMVMDGDKDELVRSLCIVEPRLLNLELLESEGQLGLWGALDGGRLLPIASLGDGLGRALSLFVSMHEARNGLIAVDEVENGIHYSVLPHLWANVFRVAVSRNLQVFASTHSLECAEAACEAVQNESNVSLALHRLYRKGDDICAEVYSGDNLGAGIEAGFDVR